MAVNVEYQKIHVLGDSEAVDASKQIVMLESPSEDEISLIDLYLVLVKHKKIMAIVIAVVLMLGAFYALSKTKVYNYSVSIQIGKMLAGKAQSEGLQSIESPDAVLSKITESYIPYILNQYVSQHPGEDVPVIKAKLLKNSDIILLESKAPENATLQSLLMQSVVDRVLADHKPLTDVMKSRYDTELSNAQISLAQIQSPVNIQAKLTPLEIALQRSVTQKKMLVNDQVNRVRRQKYMTEMQSRENRLLSLADESGYLTIQMKRLDQVDKMLEQQISVLSQSIERALANRKVSIKKIDDPSTAMTALLLDNQLQADRSRLNGLQERLTVKQKNLREKLANNIKKNTRAVEYEKTLIKDLKNNLLKMNIDDENKLADLGAVIAEKQLIIKKLKLDRQVQTARQEQAIKNISFKLAGLNETRALTETVKSMLPVGVSSKLIVVLSLFAGLFLAVFIAFALEFMEKVKQRTSQSEV